MDFQREKIDVICQHTKDQRIIPMRIRLTDEDGVIQTYNIKSYKDVTTHGSYLMPNGIRGSNYIWTFECKILVMDLLRPIKLYLVQMTLQALGTQSDIPPISIFRQSQGLYFMNFNGLRLHREKRQDRK